MFANMFKVFAAVIMLAALPAAQAATLAPTTTAGNVAKV